MVGRKRCVGREKTLSLPIKSGIMKTELERLVSRYRELGIESQIDYGKFYLYSIITLQLAKAHVPVTVEMLKELSALVMKNTGKEYRTALGDFSSAKGELRLLNVTAGVGGKSYMNYNKVPARLSEFCAWLNEERAGYSAKSISRLYEISFDAHYRLVTIHPWADGNGRMARLLMNQLQFEFGLIPAKILKEDREEYIKALVATGESGELNIFRDFMTAVMVRNLTDDIKLYCESLGEDGESREKTASGREKKTGSREKIIALLSEDGALTMAALARRTGITPKAVEKQIARLKADGILERIGPDKGGRWRIRQCGSLGGKVQ